MKVTKYEHALFTVEKDGKLLVVDPGSMSPSFAVPTGVVGIVATHAHADHFDKNLVAKIVQANPDVTIYGDAAVTAEVPDLKTQTVAAGDTVNAGGFDLEFFGGEHELIHPSASAGTNVGVLIDERIYYPGDSFSEPGRPVELLALPVSGPWMKIGEAVDFLKAVHPTKAFATHEALHSDVAKGMVKDLVGRLSGDLTTEFVTLEPGKSIEI